VHENKGADGSYAASEPDSSIFADEATVGARESSPYASLFSDAALDAIEKGELVGESECFDKELEDRLYPLDEKKTEEIMAKNDVKAEKPSLEELSRSLGINEDVLRRNEHVEAHTTEEYWLGWYEEALQTAEEAKKANRDFTDLAAASEAVVGVVSAVGETPEVRDPYLERLRAKERTRREQLMRSSARKIAYRIIVEGDSANEGMGPAAAADRSSKGGAESDGRERQDRRIRHMLETLYLREPWDFDQDFDEFLSLLTKYLESEAERIKLQRKTREHIRLMRQIRKDAKEARRVRRPLRLFEVGDLLPDRTLSLGRLELDAEREEDLSHYVEVVGVRAGLEARGEPHNASGEAETGSGLDDGRLGAGGGRAAVGAGRVCALGGGLEAVSTCLVSEQPVKVLIDTGATVSLLRGPVYDGLDDKPPLELYRGSLWSSSGHCLRVRGSVLLPVQLGSRREVGRFNVVDDMHVDAIFGTDLLATLRAVIDLEAEKLSLKDSDEEFPLGAPPRTLVAEARLKTNVQLRPGGQALVVCRVSADLGDSSTVLIEPRVRTASPFRVARSLGTASDGWVLVEVCNPTPDAMILRKGVVVALVTPLPAETILPDPDPGDCLEGGSVWPDGCRNDSSRSERAYQIREGENGADGGAKLDVDFSDSELTPEQQGLLRRELEPFSNLFVETSNAPGRTDLLQFQIDTAGHPPIKQ
jgi:hypothetical protein